jgi:hypothetical protein
MAFCFVVGTNDFTSPLKGYEGTTAQCHNCGNWSAHPISSWDWFTFCWIPIIPLGSKHQDVGSPALSGNTLLTRITACMLHMPLSSRHEVRSRCVLPRFPCDLTGRPGIAQTYNHNKGKGRHHSLYRKGRLKAGALPKGSLHAINNPKMWLDQG